MANSAPPLHMFSHRQPELSHPQLKKTWRAIQSYDWCSSGLSAFHPELGTNICTESEADQWTDFMKSETMDVHVFLTHSFSFSHQSCSRQEKWHHSGTRVGYSTAKWQHSVLMALVVTFGLGRDEHRLKTRLRGSDEHVGRVLVRLRMSS